MKSVRPWIHWIAHVFSLIIGQTVGIRLPDWQPCNHARGSLDKLQARHNGTKPRNHAGNTKIIDDVKKAI